MFRPSFDVNSKAAWETMFGTLRETARKLERFSAPIDDEHVTLYFQIPDGIRSDVWAWVFERQLEINLENIVRLGRGVEVHYLDPSKGMVCWRTDARPGVRRLEGTPGADPKPSRCALCAQAAAR